MMSRWFRFYAEALNDPKVQRLDGDTFKVWVNLLCIAAENDGVIPSPQDAAFSLRMDDNGAVTVFERLHNAGLIDKANGGKDGWHYAPHGWSKRQYKSDSSTDRVKRFRKRSVDVPETPPETEADTEQNTLAKASDAPASPDKIFWDSAISYLGASKRPLVGKWKSRYGLEETMRAITAAQVERAIDPISFIEACLKRTKRKSDSGDQFNGFC